MMRRITILVAVSCMVTSGALTAAWSQVNPHTNYTALSLGDLMNIEITSVSKRSERVSDAAAAIFVVTADDIQRSGATSIPEALRMVPGIQVARIDANKWAVTSRGFNHRYANKLLVLVDGRSVYTPLYSGVNWDVEGVLLENIERIEVIRGPGATLWGANAVNGIINVITKTSRDTQGFLFAAGGGTEQRGVGKARFGGKLKDHSHYRVALEYSNLDRTISPFQQRDFDSWSLGRLEGRLDLQPSSDDQLTLLGDFYDSRSEAISVVPDLAPPYISIEQGESTARGASALLRWQRHLSATSDISLQFYYWGSDRRSPTLGERRSTLDLELEQPFVIGSRHRVVWGMGYRYSRDQLEASGPLSFDEDRRADHLSNVFVQDDIELRDGLVLTLGSKFEHNSYTGLEIQPNARMRWTPTANQTLWGAVSRAVRTPSRSDASVRVLPLVIPPGTPDNPSPYPVAPYYQGSPDFASETVLSHEIGYRIQPTARLSLDVATFYNRYAHLRSASLDSLELRLDPTPHLEANLTANNGGHAESWGVEVGSEWRVNERWRLYPAYALLDVVVTHTSAGLDALGASYFADLGSRHVASLRSSTDLPARLSLDLWLRYTSELADGAVPEYAELDAQVSWRPAPELLFSVAGQNLLHGDHFEFPAAGIAEVPGGIQRGVHAKVVWRY